ncbi:MAG: hypothetical protein JNJ88_21135 [Planctomycetes bacterium]|nr:hypothetical protein [Planctomycetota bacterium]
MNQEITCKRVALGGTASRYDLRLGARLLSVSHDPREDGMAVFVRTQQWTFPADEVIGEGERKLLVDSLWSALGAGSGLALIETLPDQREIAHRMSGEFRVLLYEGALGYLEPGRTMIVQTAPGREALTHDNVRLLREGARWIYPERRPATEAEWRVAARRLAAAGRDTFYREVTETRIEVDPALLAEPGERLG